MTTATVLLLAPLFALVLAPQASAEISGGSGYLALMALSNVPATPFHRPRPTLSRTPDSPTLESRLSRQIPALPAVSSWPEAASGRRGRPPEDTIWSRCGRTRTSHRLD